MKDKDYLPYPVCFKEFKTAYRDTFIRQECHINSFYGDTRFTPISFYKKIISL